jgi:hypothetical protein
MAQGKLKKEPARGASSKAHQRRIKCAQEHCLLLPNIGYVWFVPASPVPG